MKSAKEMFKKLGYILVSDDINYIIYEYDEIFRLCFDKNNEIIDIWCERPMYNTLDFEELQAINKHVEELHWND